MLTVQLRKDPSVFPTQQIVHREHTLQMYAKLHFRYCNTIHWLTSTIKSLILENQQSRISSYKTK